MSSVKTVPLNSWQEIRPQITGFPEILLSFPNPEHLQWGDLTLGVKGKGPSCEIQSKQARKLENAGESLCILKEWGHAFFAVNSYLPFYYYELHHPFLFGIILFGCQGHMFLWPPSLHRNQHFIYKHKTLYPLKQVAPVLLSCWPWP